MDNEEGKEDHDEDTGSDSENKDSEDMEGNGEDSQ